MYIGQGKTVTLDESSKEQYRRNYFRIERMARSALSIPPGEAVTPQQVAATYLDKEPGWAKNTARLYRASLVFVFDQMGDSAASEARDMVYHVNEDGEWQMQIREKVKAERKKRNRAKPMTSAQKAKNMSAEDLLLLRTDLDSGRSQWAKDTRVWFFAGMLTGLRPSEWRFAQLFEDEKGRPILVVKNGKQTNGRAHGETRTIHLNGLSESNIALIAAHIKTAAMHVRQDSFDHFYYHCSRVLRTHADRLWPRRTKHPTLYTARHLFSADAKTKFDRIAVAALMGHASTDTAYDHYGKRHTGSGGMGVEPDEQDMKAVALRNPDYVPGQPSSEGAPNSPFSRLHGTGPNPSTQK